MRLIAVALLVIAALTPCGAATIYGKLYRWDTLDVVRGAVVTIEDGSVQRMVAENGSYKFEVAPGRYTLAAKWGDLEATENVTVEEGVNRYDIILFPRLEISEPPAMPEIEEEPPYYIAIAAASGAVVAMLYYLKRRESIAESHAEDLPEDLKEVLEVIKREGGRITQKELRRKLGYSEAKMSLIIADLERRGLVEKVKRGRGNVIFLKT